MSSTCSPESKFVKTMVGVFKEGVDNFMKHEGKTQAEAEKIVFSLAHSMVEASFKTECPSKIRNRKLMKKAINQYGKETYATHV